MRELSLHILDIVQNSLAADANLIEINIMESLEEDLFKIKIIDDGSGIDSETLKRISDPFVTSRKTREVGLGLSLLRAAAERCQGQFKIYSTKGKGTIVEASFQHSHLDRAPLGNIVSTIVSLVAANPEKNFNYQHKYDGQKFIFKTDEIKQELSDVKIDQPQVLNWIRGYLQEGIETLYGGEG